MKDSLTCISEVEFAVEYVSDLLPDRFESLERWLPPGRNLLISTPTVWSLHGGRMSEAIKVSGIDLQIHVMGLNEASKTLRSVEEICAKAYEYGVGRRGVLVAFGGGVCSDVVGLAASTLRRGVGHIRIPTTLIGQVDAGIGIKTAVNLGQAKNYLGSFYPPMAVIVDSTILGTLSAAHISEGLSEIVKIALVRSKRLFALIESHCDRVIGTRFAQPATIADRVIRCSVELMLEELQIDPFERTKLQRLVDMGHTFSPAIEAASGYSIPHGRAVAIDMALSCLIGERLGHCNRAVADRLLPLLRRIDLPIYVEELTVPVCRRALAAASLHRNGAVNLVVPAEIGRAVFIEDAAAIDDKLLASVLSELAEINRELDVMAPKRLSAC